MDALRPATREEALAAKAGRLAPAPLAGGADSAARTSPNRQASPAVP